ncbi:hypothetical protein [Nonomuraea sp. LPB2021202275-12-8]|uniref:hypothetical protein n=1 Tax=Nonomuraea sp. LPB2021202275-12-8 TaxID=3120159 RepID=UPI00300D2EF6
MRTADRPGTPASSPRRSRIGDLRMRVVYRGFAVVAAVAVAAVAVVLALPTRPDEAGARPVAAPSAVPASSGPPSSGPPSSGPPSSGPPSASPSPSATPSPSAATAPAVRPTPTPGASLAPGYTAMEALYADARVPRLPGKLRRQSLPAATKRVLKDSRSGLAVPRLGKPWKVYGAAPFTTRQMLPKQRGDSRRGLLVSCPLPIEAQKSPRDTALLAARWTLNHHPKDAKIRWFASQRVQGGWMLLYQVAYGKRSSRAAVVVVEGGMAKPGLTFVTVPDTQRSRWRDISRVLSGVRDLG